MNVKRFTARTAREALAQVREALGEDAVVLSTKPAPDGVEVLAMAPDGLARIEQAAAQSPAPRAPLPVPPPPPAAQAAPARRTMTLTERIAARGERLDARNEPRRNERIEPGLFADNAPAEAATDSTVARDVETLGMSTLTFQDYVRERMLKRRQTELAQQPATLQQRLAPPAAPPTAPAAESLRVLPRSERRAELAGAERHPGLRERIQVVPGPRREPPVLRDEVRLGGMGSLGGMGGKSGMGASGVSAGAGASAGLGGPGRHDLLGAAAAQQIHNPLADKAADDALGGLRDELQSVRALIDERFGMLAFMERLQRDPRQATLSQALFDAGLSPALVRKLVQALPATTADALAWAAGVLQRNLRTDEADAPLEDHDGVLALIGPTGVGKTTSTAKLAAAFATRHGAANLGLVTLDAYRVAAHEQLRTYGRILGVPVHTAHDRASLDDLLELLSGKKLVLIDTAGMAQRDARTRELMDMLQHSAIRKLLVINAAAQGETVEDVLVAYGVAQCHGVIVSKLDEAVKLGPALDALIRHRARVVGVANGQRVPEDWHRLSAQALVQRALRGGGNAAWKLDASEVNLVFAAIHGAGYPAAAAATAAGQGAPLPG